MTFWGTNDADSWRADSFPLLFDKNLRAKEAFKAVLDPAKYMNETVPPQEIPKARSHYGTPTLGTNDAAWQKAAIINVNKKPTDQSVNAGATAVVKTLWDASYFYVHANVTDTKLDKTSVNPWEQDSVEVFISETAHRNASYTDGDGQYRVNFEGRKSFKSSELADKFESYAAVTDTGYIVEMKIPFREIQPRDDTAVSFDVQINDVSTGASTRLLTVWSDLQANGYNTTELWGTLTLTQPMDGVHVYATSKGDGYSGANIILGNNETRWPFSKAGADGAVAFTPEKDATYRLTFNVSSSGASALRIRWIKDAENGNYTSQDTATVNNNVYGDSVTATKIPAHFTGSNVLAAGQTKNFDAYFTLDGNAQPNGLIGNIAIRGSAGSNEFTINSLTIEKVEAGSNVMLVNWPTPTPTPTPVQTVKDGRIAATPVMDKDAKKAVASLNQETVNKALELAQKDSGGAKKVIIDISSVTGTDSYAQELPRQALSAQASVNRFEINTPLASITLPDNMFGNITGIGPDKVSITVGKGNTALLPASVRNQIGSRPVIELGVTLGREALSWNNPDAPVVISVDWKPTAEELKDPEHIVVWYIDGLGNVVSVPSGRYDAATGKVTFKTTHFSQFAIAFDKKTFNDIDNHPWARKQIEILASKGIIKGTSDGSGTFGPSVNITRLEFICMLVKTLGINAKVNTNFADVGKAKNYYQAVGIAKKLEITRGTGNNMFMPYSQITQQDMMVLTARALNAADKKLAAASASDIRGYSDVSKVSDYAALSVAELVKADIVKGSGNRLMPEGTATRAEAAVIMYSIYNK